MDGGGEDLRKQFLSLPPACGGVGGSPRQCPFLQNIWVGDPFFPVTKTWWWAMTLCFAFVHSQSKALAPPHSPTHSGSLVSRAQAPLGGQNSPDYIQEV